MYEDMSRLVAQRHPSMKIEGATYPPPPARRYLATAVQMFKFFLIFLTIASINPFLYCGVETPGFFTYALENKVSFCLMTFFMCGLVEGQLLSTGAFEIYFNDIPVWSKLESKRVPRPDELLQILSSHTQFDPPTMPRQQPNDGGL